MVDYTRDRHRLSLKKFFGAQRKADGYFRQLERLVRQQQLALSGVQSNTIYKSLTHFSHFLVVKEIKAIWYF